MSKIEVPVRFIKAALLTAGKKDIRYYLNGILIERVPFATYVVSTDGHRLMVCRDAWTKPEPQVEDQIIVPRSLLESVLKGTSKAENFITFEFDGAKGSRKITASVCDGSFSAKETDSRFPDWRRVVPDKCNGLLTWENKSGTVEEFFYDPVYLHDFSKAVAILGGNRSSYMIHVQPNGGGSARVHLSCDDAIGVIMPFRSNAIHPDIADWYKADRPKVEEPEVAAT